MKAGKQMRYQAPGRIAKRTRRAGTPALTSNHSCTPNVQAGFTLLEMVIVITILGITAASAAAFIMPTMQSYIDTGRRAEMTDAADNALRRISRDVHAALPNSLRTTQGGSTACIEYIPVVGGGRYRAIPSNTGTGNILDFSSADNRFDYLAGSMPTTTGNRVVIWNMGSRGPLSPTADAYQGDNTASISSIDTSARQISLAPAKKFPYESPDRRFLIIPDHSTIYSCSQGQLIKTQRSITATALTSCPDASAPGGLVIVEHVDCAGSRFDFSADSLSNFGLLALTLSLQDADSGERVRLYSEVRISNAP